MKALNQLALVLVLCVGLTACALFADRQGPVINIVQDSDYCGTPTAQADIRYFNAPDPFAAWIDSRDIRELRAAAASLTGVLVVELGQRPSQGYAFEVIPDATRIEGETLYLAMRWSGPEIDDHVAQVVVSPCVVIPRPEGEYSQVVLIDQRGEQRASVAIP